MSESDFGCFEFFISSIISMDLHSTAPAVPTVFWVELDLRSCCFTEWLSLSQISGLTRGVARVSHFAGRKYLADLSLSFESDNFLDHRLLIKSASCFSAAGPDSSALRRSPAISDSNGSLSPSLCSSRARGLSLEVLSASVPQKP